MHHVILTAPTYVVYTITWLRYYDACDGVTLIPPQWHTIESKVVHCHHSDVVGGVVLQSCQVVVGVSTPSVHCSEVGVICSILNLIHWSSIGFSWW